MAKNYQNKIRVKGLKVEVGDNLNGALRKLKKKVDEDGLLQEVIKRRYYEKPTTERKRKAGAAKARLRKKLRLEKLLPKKR
jgi:small subunit ribosomal protein S21